MWIQLGNQGSVVTVEVTIISRPKGIQTSEEQSEVFLNIFQVHKLVYLEYTQKPNYQETSGDSVMSSKYSLVQETRPVGDTSAI